MTIDCSLIPVVELDDGSTVLLDFGNRLSDNLKALISQSWTNYGFLSADELRDDIASLQGIIRRSRNYTMSRVNTPLALTAKPEILVFPDWIIAAKKAVGGVLYRQGLFLLGEQRTTPSRQGPVPSWRRTALIVTEIAEGSCTCATRYAARDTGDSRPAGDSRASPSRKQLLKILGETPVRNAGVAIFDQARDGFNLSITADLLLRKGENGYLIHTKRLPDQFVRILKDQGTEVILLRENASGTIPDRGSAPAPQHPHLFRPFLLPDSGRGQPPPAHHAPFPPSGRRPAANRSIWSISTFHPTPCLSSRAAWGDVFAKY